MRNFILLVLGLWSQQIMSQGLVKGIIRNEKGGPVAYAGIFIKAAKVGTTTDTSGHFKMVVTRKGIDTLIVNSMGFEQLVYPIKLDDKEINLDLRLTEISATLNEVVISAGTIQASNERAVAILKPLDIVTTAGGQADIAGAIQTLPGVQRNGGDQTGLMVRGGDVSESAMIIDGTVSQNAFFSSIPGVSQRSRFSPFSFKGTAFSSGGYSVRYGQALSSVLDLQTNDLPEKTTINLGANFAGIAASGAKLMDNNAIEYSGYYNHLAPYYALAKTNMDFYNVPQGGGFATRWVSKVGDKGMFKMTFNQGYTKTGIGIPDPANPGTRIRFGLQNENTFFNTSYRQWITKKLKYFTAFSFSNNTDNISWGSVAAYRNDSRVQGRGEISYQLRRKLNILSGIELQRISYTQKYDTLTGKFDETLVAGYLEAEGKVKRRFAVKPGVRAEYSQLLGKGNIAPRLSFAYKVAEYSQVSFAGGLFYQLAPPQYLIQGYKPGFQQASHYMLNYQWLKNDRTLRIEGYYKSYNQLIREKGVPYNPNQYRFNYGTVDNSGNGYAQGLDFFWRDKKSIKNFDYWISYSYIDTKRIYQNYIAKVTPDYVSTNNLNIITKYFIDKWQTNISVSYNYASGRGYYNPGSPIFLSDKAPDYHNISISMAYLTTIKNMFTVFYLSLDNVTNQHNILGYRYSNNGTERYPVVPAIYRSIFFGVNFSLTKFSKDEL